MRSSRTAIQSRHGQGDQRTSIVEYALMMALIAVLVISSALLLVARLSSQ